MNPPTPSGGNKPFLLIDIIVLGAKFKGKATLADRFLQPGPPSAEKQVEIKNKKYSINVETQIFLGEIQNHKPQTPLGVILVYSTSSQDSFALVDFIHTNARTQPDFIVSSILVVGLVVDLSQPRVISTQTGKEFADRHKLPFVELQITDKKAIDQAFRSLIKAVIRNPIIRPMTAPPSEIPANSRRTQTMPQSSSQGLLSFISKESLRKSSTSPTKSGPFFSDRPKTSVSSGGSDKSACLNPDLWVKKRNALELVQWTKNDGFYSYVASGTHLKQFIDAFDLLLGGRKLKDNINEITVVYNKHLSSVFEHERKNWQNRHKENKGQFKAKKWKLAPEEELLKKERVYQAFKERSREFPWNQKGKLPILPVVHGTDLAIAQKICKEGFANTGTLDAGYYGSGIYFSSHAMYTCPYFISKTNPTLVLCLLIPGNTYPVTEPPKTDASLMGSALKNGYQSHFVLTNKKGDISDGTGPEYDEFVVTQPYQALPICYITLKNQNFTELGMEWGRMTALETPMIFEDKPNL